MVTTGTTPSGPENRKSMNAAMPKSVSTFLEREVKLAVEQRFRLPDLGGKPLPSRVLTSTYSRHARFPVGLRRDYAPTSRGAGHELMATEAACGQSAARTRSQGGTRQSAAGPNGFAHGACSSRVVDRGRQASYLAQGCTGSGRRGKLGGCRAGCGACAP